MYTKPAPRTDQQSLFFDLESQLNQKHTLYLLANKIDWNVFEEAFKGLYCANNGRPAKPIRRMVGLLILKHVRNVSDESVVEQWQENIYYQYFCGEQSIQTSAPCTPTELVEFRKRIGEEGVELILKESTLLCVFAKLTQKDKVPRRRTAPLESSRAGPGPRNILAGGRLLWPQKGWGE